jgi:GNAT superfamily N-acetyltransferase
VIRREDYEFIHLRSVDNEAAFFARMGHFFASATVRRECGGYPLSDSPRHRWFVVQRKGDTCVLGFISIEQQSNAVRIRDGYLRPVARRHGLFRELLQQVLGYIDELGLACTTRVPQSCAKLLAPHGFHVLSTRGSWVTLERNAHATRHGSDESGRSAV